METLLSPASTVFLLQAQWQGGLRGACNEAAFTFTSNLTSEKRLIASQDPGD
jgi:hypothetical protein